MRASKRAPSLRSEHAFERAHVEATHRGFHFFLHEGLRVFDGLVDGGAGEVGEEFSVGERGGGGVGDADDFEEAVGGGGHQRAAGGCRWP